MSIRRNILGGMVGGGGCLVIGLFILALVVFVFCVAPMLTAGLIWLGWNLAIAPIFNVAPITYFWQSIGLAICVMIVGSIFKGMFRSRKED